MLDRGFKRHKFTCAGRIVINTQNIDFSSPETCAKKSPVENDCNVKSMCYFRFFGGVGGGVQGRGNNSYGTFNV